MKIYDEHLENELKNVDLEKGHLEPARRLVAHHEALERQYHYEVMDGTVTDDCPEGLRREVEDVAAHEPWDEYEEVQRYVPYTEAELAKIAAEKQAEAERQATIEAERAKIEAEYKKAQEEAQAKAEAAAKEKAKQAEKIARIDAIDAQVTYTAMMTDTLMVEEEA